MAATITYNSAVSVYDGKYRVRRVSVTVSGTLDGTETLSPNGCGLNTIDSVVGGVLVGTVRNVTSKAALMKVVSSSATAPPITIYNDGGTTNAGFALDTNGTTYSATAELLVIGN